MNNWRRVVAGWICVSIGEVGQMGGGDASMDELLMRVTISEVVALLSIM